MPDYSDKYSEEGFWKKIRKIGKAVPFARDVLGMFFCLFDPTIPPWAKALIIAALGYFIFPLDAIPDVFPGIGYLDDAGVIATALVAVRFLIKEEHWKKAEEILAGL